MRPTLIVLILMLWLAGCGNKGPLYLPDQKPPSRKSAAKPQPPAEKPATDPAAETPAKP